MEFPYNFFEDSYEVIRDNMKGAEYVPVFFVTTFTYSRFGTVLKAATGARYSHSAMGFHPDLETLYSFNAATTRGAGGLSLESLSAYVKTHELSEIFVGMVMLKNREYNVLRKELNRIIKNQDKSSYNFKGIFNIMINRPGKKKDDFSMVCSEFVDRMFKLIDIDLSGKNYALARPQDLRDSENRRIYLVYEGFAKDYNVHKTNRIIGRLKHLLSIGKHAELLGESVEDVSIPAIGGGLVDLRKLDIFQESEDFEKKLIPKDIIRILQEFPYPKKEYVVSYKAGLVLQGVVGECNDVDLLCSKRLGKRLIKDGYKYEPAPSGNTVRITINDRLEAFPQMLQNRETVTIDGFQVDTLYTIYQIYKKMWEDRHRPKDIATIQAIKEYLLEYDMLNESGKDLIPYEESCKDLATARKFVWEVGKLARKYNANYFIVTDGASGTHNENNPAVLHAREAHKEWERNHRFDPDEDWRDEMESSLDGELHIYDRRKDLDYIIESEETHNILTFLDGLNKNLNSYSYGVLDKHGKLIDPHPNDYATLYHYLSPYEFDRARGGVCWDYVGYQSDNLRRYNIPHMNYYIVFDLPPYYDTHTFTVVSLGNCFLYLESSYKRLQNIYVADNLEDIFNFILYNMAKDFVDRCRRERRPLPRREIPFEIHEYESYTNYGVDAVTFMKEMEQYKLCKKGVWKISQRAKELSRLSEIANPDAYFEASETSTGILQNLVEPRIISVLSTPEGDRKYRKIINSYIERNIGKITTPGPMYQLIFGDRDQQEYFDLFGITRQEITDAMVQLTNTLKKGNQQSSDFKYLRGNPIFPILYYCIRFYTRKRDEKGVNVSLSIYALSVYWSVFNKYYPKGVNGPVMSYTIDNMTDKFLIKKCDHVFGLLVESIKRSYDFHKDRILIGDDTCMVSWIQRIRNDQNSLIKKITNEYTKNYKSGKAISTRNDNYDSDNPILDDISNATTLVQMQVSKVTMPIIANGVDIPFAQAAAKMAQISISDCRDYLIKIMVPKNLPVLEKFVESILFLFIYESQRSINDIRSQYFLAWAASLFKKTNSKNNNINRINSILEQWAEESGIYERFKREASRINYKKAIFFYVILSIQKYS